MQPGKGFAPQSGRTAAVLAAATRGPGPTTRLHQPPQLPRELARGTHHLTPAGPGREPPVDGGHPIPAVVVRAGARIAVPRPPVQLHEQRSAACRRSWRPARVCCWLSPNGGPCGRSTPLTKRSSSTLSAPAAVGVSTSIRSERQRCRAGPASASRNDAGVVRWVATALTTTAIAASNGIVSARSNTVSSTAVRQGQAAGSNRCCRNRLRCNRIPGAGRTRRRWSTRRSTTCGAGPRPCRKAALRCDGAAEPKTSPSLGGLVGGAI